MTNEKDLLDCLNAVLLKNNFTKTLVDLLNYLNILIVENPESNSERKMHKKLFDFTHKCIEIGRHFSNYSVIFRNQFHEIDGLKTLGKFISNKYLIDEYIKYSQQEKTHGKEFTEFNRLIRGTLGTLFNLCREFDNYSNKWQEEQLFETIFELAEKIKDIKDNQITCCMLLASIATDKQIDKFDDLNRVLPQIVQIVSKCAKAIQKIDKLERVKIQINGETKEICRVIETRAWNLVECLNALYHLAVSDKIKCLIYNKYQVNEHLRIIIFHGNDIEIEYALNLLWQLCFNETIKNQIILDHELVDLIKSYSLKQDESSKKVKKNSLGILWLLNQITESSKSEKITKKLNEKHLMISYNKFSRELCIQIKNFLENIGHKVIIIIIIILKIIDIIIDIYYFNFYLKR